jgi:hypothetical protein
MKCPHDGPVANVLVSEAAVRIHQAIEAGRRAGMPRSEFRPRNRSWGSQMKIPPTIEPIAHISPYRRIDPSHPGRKRAHAGRMEGKREHAQARPGDLQL